MLQERIFAGATSADIARRVDSVSDIAPGFARYLLAYPFGDGGTEAGLDRKTRGLASVAGLTVLGNDRQLRVQIAAALELGCSPEEIVETITQMADYAGITAALNALSVAKQIFARSNDADDWD
ncbi:MAG TPA: carboxymuconolactone decarboxylase family protein [Kiloniellales bacterium]|nr:carboxymuconolactone decarboxylase family protein [Kiloniellales bacterium]